MLVTRFPDRNDMICHACQQAGFTPQLVHRVESLRALLAKVAAGDGETLTPCEDSYKADFVNDAIPFQR